MATQYSNPTGSGPGQVTALPGGVVWYPTVSSVQRMSFSGASATPTTYLFPGLAPSKLVSGADGGMWFVDIDGSRYGTVAPTGDANYYDVSGANFRGVGIGPNGRIAGSDAARAKLILSTTDVYADPAHPGVLSGTATVGSTLTVTDPGAFTTSGPVTLDYSWARCPSMVNDLATCTYSDTYSPTHVVTAADVGSFLLAQVSASNGYANGYLELWTTQVPAPPPVVVPPTPAPAPPVAAPAFTPEQWWAFIVYLQNLEKLKQTCKSVRTRVHGRWVTKTVCKKVVAKKPAKPAKKVIRRKR